MTAAYSRHRIEEDTKERKRLCSFPTPRHSDMARDILEFRLSLKYWGTNLGLEIGAPQIRNQGLYPTHIYMRVVLWKTEPHFARIMRMAITLTDAHFQKLGEKVLYPTCEAVNE
jgi:hypothetical protein